MADLTILELIQHKHKLEQELTSLIDGAVARFNVATGYSVKYITGRFVEATTFGDPLPVFVLSEIKVELAIPEL